MSTTVSFHLASAGRDRGGDKLESFLICSVPVTFWLLNWNVTEQVQGEILLGDSPCKDLGIKGVSSGDD